MTVVGVEAPWSVSLDQGEIRPTFSVIPASHEGLDKEWNLNRRKRRAAPGVCCRCSEDAGYFSAFTSSHILMYFCSRLLSTAARKMPSSRCLTGSAIPSSATCFGSAIWKAFMLLWP